MKKLFKKFLKDNGCYDEYMENIRNSFEKITKQLKPNRWLKGDLEKFDGKDRNIVFEWMTTKQGNEYWSEIDKKWQSYLKVIETVETYKKSIEEEDNITKLAIEKTHKEAQEVFDKMFNSPLDQLKDLNLDGDSEYVEFPKNKLIEKIPLDDIFYWGTKSVYAHVAMNNGSTRHYYDCKTKMTKKYLKIYETNKEV